MSTPAEAKAIIRRWNEEGWSGGKYDLAYEIIAPVMTVHGAGGQPVNSGPDGLIDLIKTWRTAFPDGNMTIDDIIVEGEVVAIRNTWHGTQKESFYGIPPSGRWVDVTSIGIDRVVNGKVVEGWGELDMVGMMQQLGALPIVGSGAVSQRKSPLWGASRTASTLRTTSAQENKDILLRFIDAISKGDRRALEGIVDVFAYVEHNPVWGVETLTGSMASYAMLHEAMPDLHFEPERNIMVAEGDQVAAHSIVTGTHTGAKLFGVAPTGKRVQWTHSDFVRISEGKIVERWVSADIMTLFQQTGILPSPGGSDGEAKKMPGEENKAIYRRFVEEVVNQGKFDVVEELYSPDYKDHSAPPGAPGGLAGVKATMGMFRTAFPDVHFTIVHMVAEGDMVGTYVTGEGTQNGAFLGQAPTGRHVRWASTGFFRVANGKIVEHWGVPDLFAIMNQIGPEHH